MFVRINHRRHSRFSHGSTSLSCPPFCPRKVLIAQLDLEAQHAVGQAADLSDRLAGAEQDLNFETNRNTERLRARDKGNARLRAAAAAAEKRVAVAENALRRKGREIEELRAKCAREGLLGGGRGTGGRRRGTGGGRMNTATSTTAGLEFRVFAAAAGAQSSVERCAVAAAERRVAAGSGLAEALRIAESEANTNRAEIDFPSDDDDDNSGRWRSCGPEVVLKCWAKVCIHVVILKGVHASIQPHSRLLLEWSILGVCVKTRLLIRIYSVWFGTLKSISQLTDFVGVFHIPFAYSRLRVGRNGPL